MDWVQRINEMAWGYKDAAILLNSLRVGIFEALGQDWLTADEVAAKYDLDARATDVVLHALTAAGICQQDGELFASEPEARPLLLADSPTTLKSILGHNLFMMRGWAHLDQVMQSGEPIRNQEQTNDQMRDFICGMENVSRVSSQEVVAKIDLGSVKRLLDLGGGPGTAAITFAQANPGLEGVVFDLEGPIEIAREQIAKAELSQRLTTVAGDFHTDDIGGAVETERSSGELLLDPSRSPGVGGCGHHCRGLPCSGLPGKAGTGNHGHGPPPQPGSQQFLEDLGHSEMGLLLQALGGTDHDLARRHKRRHSSGQVTAEV